MPVPQLTEEQRREALQKAMAARTERAGILRRLKDGSATIEDVLADPAAQKIRVESLIKALPGYGVARTSQVMHKVGIAPNRRIKGLGTKQREELFEVINGTD